MKKFRICARHIDMPIRFQPERPEAVVDWGIEKIEDQYSSAPPLPIMSVTGMPPPELTVAKGYAFVWYEREA